MNVAQVAKVLGCIKNQQAVPSSILIYGDVLEVHWADGMINDYDVNGQPVIRT